MSLGDILFQIVIRPIEIILEVIYGVGNTVTGNIGLSILVLSLFINIVLLPFYRMADKIQKEERDLEARLAFWKNHINKTFSGDERFMMLRTYYRQNGYKPYYSLKSIFPLFLEVPFFLAAYHFLSHLEELHGTAFLMFRDLGAPDAALNINGLTLNLLPILMTIINLISSSIYTKEAPAKEKVQLYGMALIFLILLYDSPSGLVLYWTANNLFSLIKNLIQVFRIPSRILNSVLAVIGVIAIIIIIPFYHPFRWKHKAVAILFCIMLLIPKVFVQVKKRLPDHDIFSSIPSDTRWFSLGCLCMTVLTGLMIPASVIASSPAEFVLVSSYQTPLIHVVNSLLISFGFFMLWLGVFYRLSDKKMQPIFVVGIWIVCWCSLVNYLFFGTKLGTLTSELTFVDGIKFSSSETIINLAVLFAIITAAIAVFMKKSQIVKGVLTVLLVSICGISVFHIVRIQSEIPEIKRVISLQNNETAHFTLSENGQNVVVLMLDRAISSYLPVIFEEKPELQEKYAGFTYYPNTISHGAQTTIGAPGLFGGYEYTPEEMNSRSDEKLVDKHNEALQVMPALFGEAGYDVTICDPPYAGYSEIPDLSVFSKHPEYHTYLTENGQFRLNLLSDDNPDEYVKEAWRRNFFCYSMMKIAPVIIQGNLYKDGSYYNGYS